MDELPQPRPVARALLQWTQGEDAPAFAADLTELLDGAELTGWRRWTRGWGEILSTLRIERRQKRRESRGRNEMPAPADRRHSHPDLRADSPGLRADSSTGLRTATSPGLRADSSTGLRPRLALRLALKGLRKDPATAGTAVLILALGLAAPTVFFSILWGISGRPLPVPEGHEVVRIDLVQPVGSGRTTEVTAADVDALRALSEFREVASYGTSRFQVAVADGPLTEVQGARLDPETFTLLSVQPQLGRLPSPDEWETTYLLGFNSWQRLFGGDPGVLGSQLSIDGLDRKVIGIMGQDFGFPLQQDGWTLLGPGPETQLAVVARLAPGVSKAQAERAVTRVWERRDPHRPVEARQATPQVLGFTEARGEGGELVLLLALVAIGIALLTIAVANASNLMLVRSADRSTVMALQGALGATRAQLTLQILTESLLLSLAGGALGLALAGVGAGYVQDSMGQNFGYYWIQVDIAPVVALFTSALVLGSGLLAGLLPALGLRRADLHGALRSGPPGDAVGGGRWTRGLVTLQLALSCAALVATAVTVRSTASARSFGGDLPSEQVAMLTWSSVPVASGAPSPTRDPGEAPAVGGRTQPSPQGPDLITALRAELAPLRIDGRIALATAAPGYFERVTPVRLPGTEEESAPAGHLSNVVGPEYFELFEIGLVAGRSLAPTDDEAALAVAVVSESWGARWLADASPIGTLIRAPAHFGEEPVTVVGVVRDVPLATGARARSDRIYFAIDQVRPQNGLILVRSPNLGTALAEVRSGLAGGSGLGPWSIGGALTLAEGHRFMTRVQQTFGVLVLLGGLFGLLIAAVGLYGLLSHRIRQRRREFGVRLALGADSGTLVRSVLSVAARQILPATVIGLGLAWIAAPVMGIISLGEDPRDPWLYLQVVIVFGGTALLAAWLPARRAGAVDPAQTLKADG